MRVPTYAEIVRWDDTTLINWRREAKAVLVRDPCNDALQRVYDASTQEVANRARDSWGATPTVRRTG